MEKPNIHVLTYIMIICVRLYSIFILLHSYYAIEHPGAYGVGSARRWHGRRARGGGVRGGLAGPSPTGQDRPRGGDGGICAEMVKTEGKISNL